MLCKVLMVSLVLLLIYLHCTKIHKSVDFQLFLNVNKSHNVLLYSEEVLSEATKY